MAANDGAREVVLSRFKARLQRLGDLVVSRPSAAQPPEPQEASPLASPKARATGLEAVLRAHERVRPRALPACVERRASA